MTLKIISKSNIIPSIWDGGKTYEYIIYPEDSSYTNRDFDIRISSASIDKTPSSFTKFKGYKRYLIMLDNELVINRNGKNEKYSTNEIFEFDSEDDIQSFSLGNDFNLMIKNESKSVDLNVNYFEGDYTQKFIFAFAIEETLLIINNREVQLKINDLLIIENNNYEVVKCISNQNMIVGFM